MSFVNDLFRSMQHSWAEEKALLMQAGTKPIKYGGYVKVEDCKLESVYEEDKKDEQN